MSGSFFNYFLNAKILNGSKCDESDFDISHHYCIFLFSRWNNSFLRKNRQPAIPVIVLLPAPGQPEKQPFSHYKLSLNQCGNHLIHLFFWI